jgi:quercetin dioxygenase-like cupin family protein
MKTAKKHKISGPKPLKMLKGVEGMPVGLDQLMLNLVRLEKNSVVPEHKHKEEQATFIFSGALAFTLDGKKFLLKPGDCILIPSNAPHSAKAVKKTLACDSFSPPRYDYLEKLDKGRKK